MSDLDCPYSPLTELGVQVIAGLVGELILLLRKTKQLIFREVLIIRHVVSFIALALTRSKPLA
ncbi:MAG: hypothetical protein WAL08_03455, partial [Candidatus Sulfotelmatobacter sp.]